MNPSSTIDPTAKIPVTSLYTSPSLKIRSPSAFISEYPPNRATSADPMQVMMIIIRTPKVREGIVFWDYSYPIAFANFKLYQLGYGL